MEGSTPSMPASPIIGSRIEQGIFKLPLHSVIFCPVPTAVYLCLLIFSRADLQRRRDHPAH